MAPGCTELLVDFAESYFEEYKRKLENDEENFHPWCRETRMCEDGDKLVRRRTFDPQQQNTVFPAAYGMRPRNAVLSPFSFYFSLGPEILAKGSRVQQTTASEKKTTATAKEKRPHNPSPKPLGQNMNVVPTVRVAGDPDLLLNTESILECLRPLLFREDQSCQGVLPAVAAGAGSPCGGVDVQYDQLTSNTTTPPADDPLLDVVLFECNKGDSKATNRKRRRAGEQPVVAIQEQEEVGGRGSEGINASMTNQKTALSLPSYDATTEGGGDIGGDKEIELTDQQAALWEERFKELVAYRNRFGHCLVPHKWPENLALATWVKRQRYQWKLREQGKRSTLTKERRDALDNLGFVWDSHNAIWEERFNELVEFKEQHGHTSVPSTYTNHSLSVWVQCQRRQWKLMKEEEKSNTTHTKQGAAAYKIKKNRVQRLEELGFIWEPRRSKTTSAEFSPGEAGI